jgi:hypothetical protein
MTHLAFMRPLLRRTCQLRVSKALRDGGFMSCLVLVVGVTQEALQLAQALDRWPKLVPRPDHRVPRVLAPT